MCHDAILTPMDAWGPDPSRDRLNRLKSQSSIYKYIIHVKLYIPIEYICYILQDMERLFKYLSYNLWSYYIRRRLAGGEATDAAGLLSQRRRLPAQRIAAGGRVGLLSLDAHHSGACLRHFLGSERRRPLEYLLKITGISTES